MLVKLERIKKDSIAKEADNATRISKLQAELSHCHAESLQCAGALKRNQIERLELRTKAAKGATQITALGDDFKLRESPLSDGTVRQKVAIVVHAYYPSIFLELLSFIRQLPKNNSKLFVTTTTEHEQTICDQLQKSGMAHSLRVVPNRGRDILPFIKIYSDLRSEGYDLILKVHTKKSVDPKLGRQWRADVFEKLLRRPNFEKSLRAFEADATLGMIGPEGHYVSMRTYIGRNAGSVRSIGARLGVKKPAQGFFAGTMFIARAAALDRLLALEFKDEDFEPESGQLDGTMAHALERALALSVVASGFRIATTENPELWPDPTHYYAFVENRERGGLRKGSLRAVRKKVKRRVARIFADVVCRNL
jgi:lipopolysaccharide biosynthesis protein